MIIVAPEYISKSTLPCCSDIFFYESFSYSIPLGFSPEEFASVVGFIEYCKKNRIQLRNAFWGMYHGYFQAAAEANECIDILKPLKNKISFVLFSYPRDLKTINLSKSLINKELFEKFADVRLDPNFFSREIISHILFELYLESGYKGCVKYIRANLKSDHTLHKLIVAVIFNRLRIYASNDFQLTIVNPSWVPVLDILVRSSYMLYELRHVYDTKGLEATKSHMLNNTDDIFRTNLKGMSPIEFRTHRLFTELLFPIFGRCDSMKKTELCISVLEKKQDSIQAMKILLSDFATEMELIPSADEDLRQTRFQQLLNSKILEPLSAIIEHPKKEAKDLIMNTILDSGIMAGILAALKSPSENLVLISIAASAITNGMRKLVSLGGNLSPIDILYKGMNKLNKDYDDFAQNVSKIQEKFTDAKLFEKS